MIKINKYSLIILLVLIFSFSGCVEKRVIKVTTVDRTHHRYKEPIKRVTRAGFPREERVKEEILIRNNPNLGNIKVLVPKNRATLDVNISETESNSDIDELESKEEHKIVQRVDFPEEEYRNLLKFGNSEVSGRVYIINNQTDEKIVKESLKLYLNPVTSYSRQWYEESYLNGNKMTPPDRRLFNYLKYTVSDADGNFSFFGVPKGNYYLGVRIDCGSECGFDKKRIIRIVKEIYVDGDLKDIELFKSVP